MYCCALKAFYNHVGGLSSTTTSVQHPLGWYDGCHRKPVPVRSPHTSYTWRGERVIDPIKWMGIIRRPWLTFPRPARSGHWRANCGLDFSVGSGLDIFAAGGFDFLAAGGFEGAVNCGYRWAANGGLDLAMDGDLVRAADYSLRWAAYAGLDLTMDGGLDLAMDGGLIGAADCG